MSSKKAGDFVFSDSKLFWTPKSGTCKMDTFQKRSQGPFATCRYQWDSSNTPIITCDKLRCIGLIANVWWPLPAGSRALKLAISRYLWSRAQLPLNDSCGMTSQCQARMLRQASVPERLQVHVMGIVVGIILHRLSECICLRTTRLGWNTVLQLSHHGWPYFTRHHHNRRVQVIVPDCKNKTFPEITAPNAQGILKYLNWTLNNEQLLVASRSLAHELTNTSECMGWQDHHGKSGQPWKIL